MYTWYHMASSSWNHETSIPNDSREDLSRSRAHRAHLLQLVFQHLNLLLACVGSMLRQVLLPAWNSLVSFCDISPMQDSLILRVSKESFRFSCWRSTCSRSAIFSDTNSATFQLQPATLLGPSLTRWKRHLLFTWLLTVFHCFPLSLFKRFKKPFILASLLSAGLKFRNITSPRLFRHGSSGTLICMRCPDGLCYFALQTQVT